MEEEGKKRILIIILISLFLVGILGVFLQNRLGRFWSATSDLKSASKKLQKIKIFDFEMVLTSALSPYQVISKTNGEIELPDRLKATISPGKEIILTDKNAYLKTEKDQKWYQAPNTSLASKIIFKPADYLGCFKKPEKLGKSYYKGEVDLSKCASLFENLKSFLKTSGEPKIEEIWLENGLPSKIKVEFKERLELLSILQVSLTYPKEAKIEAPKDVIEEETLKEMNARDQKRKEALNLIKKALEDYAKDSGSGFPVISAWENISQSTVLSMILVPYYIDSLPKDPLEPDYYFVYQSLDGTTFSLRCILENKADPEGRQEDNLFIYEISGNLTQGGQGAPTGFYPY